MKAELSNSNVQISISKQYPYRMLRYQIFQFLNGVALTMFRSFDIQKLFGIWSLDIRYCSTGNGAWRTGRESLHE